MELNDVQKIKEILTELERYNMTWITEVTEEISQLYNKCNEILPLITEVNNEMKENREQVSRETYNLVKDFLNNYAKLKNSIEKIKDFEERKEKIREIFKKDKTPEGRVIYATHPRVKKITYDYDEVDYEIGEKIYTTSTLLKLDSLCHPECYFDDYKSSSLFFSNLIPYKSVDYNDVEYPKNHGVPVTRCAGSRIYIKRERDISSREKRGCKNVENKIKNICESKNPKYDKLGKVSFYVKGPGGGEEITIDKISQRDLAKVGILPEHLDWKKIENPTITPKDMARADIEVEVNKADLMLIKKKGLKEWIKGLVDKRMDKGEK